MDDKDEILKMSFKVFGPESEKRGQNQDLGHREGFLFKIS